MFNIVVIEDDIKLAIKELINAFVDDMDVNDIVKVNLTEDDGFDGEDCIYCRHIVCFLS